MKVKAIKIKKIVSPHDDLIELIDGVANLREGSILAISSKIVSLCEGRVLSKKQVPSKDELVKREAVWYIPRSKVPGRRGLITIKNSALILSAGIDEFDGNYVLLPKDPAATAKKIQHYLRKKLHLEKLGVIVTDSHTLPMRRGILGFALGYYGFYPLRSYEGKLHLSGRKMRLTKANVVDALAAAAVLVMGEGGERTPFAVITEVPDIQFVNRAYCPKIQLDRFEIPLKHDIFRPILGGKIWQKNSKRKRSFGARAVGKGKRKKRFSR